MLNFHKRQLPVIIAKKGGCYGGKEVLYYYEGHKEI